MFILYRPDGSAVNDRAYKSRAAVNDRAYKSRAAVNKTSTAVRLFRFSNIKFYTFFNFYAVQLLCFSA